VHKHQAATNLERIYSENREVDEMMNYMLARLEYENQVRRAERAALRPRIEKRSRRSIDLKSLLTLIARF
jgi:hypothetical protein